MPQGAGGRAGQVSRRRYEREQVARREAEQLLERKSRELFDANQALKRHASDLEQAVQQRTRDLELARREAEAANQAKSAFLAVMSHEIRTPLNGVLGMASSLSEGSMSEDQREALEVIHSSGDMLLTIVNDILDLSKVEAGKLELEILPCPVSGVVASVCRQFEAHIKEKGLSFTSLSSGMLAEGEVWAELDPTRLRQVLGNLLSNAVKFTDKGAITLLAKATTGPDERLQLEFAVRDTGQGIAEARQARLFQPYHQADASIARRHGGTGLGLVISQRICQQMGGGITFVSAEGAGSEFSVKLEVPRAEAAEQSGDVWEDSYDAVLSQRRWRVLVAEDNRTNRLVLQHLLRPFDLEVTMAEDGAEVIHAWRETGADLILMDVNMPVLDGLSATAEIRKEEARLGRAPVPVIAISANAMRHQVEAYLAGGMTSHVAKPVRRVDLVIAMAQALSGAAGAGRG